MKKLLKFIANSLQIHCKFIAFFSFFLVANSFWSLGQDKEKAEAERQMTQKLATFDLSGLKTNFLLNKGVFTTAEIDPRGSFIHFLNFF